MILNNLKEYYLPEDSKAVVELLAKYQEDAMIVAGGTFIHGLIARGLINNVDVLIDISRLGLNYIKTDAGELTIGATTTFTQMCENEAIKNNSLYGAINDALEYPPAQIKNVATIGGCISTSCPFFDLPVSFLALNSTVKAQGTGDGRQIPLDTFFSGLFENVLTDNEFMFELSVPAASGKTASAFIKLETNANDLAILNTAVCISIDDSDKCSAARVYVGGGVGESPERARAAEAILIGQFLSEKKCSEAAQAALSDIDPIADHRAPAKYRKAMIEVLIERTLAQTLSRLR